LAARSEIDPQQLASNQIRRIVGQKMHATNHRIRREHEVPTRRRRQQCRIVAQIHRPRPGERAEIFRDQSEFRRKGIRHGIRLGLVGWRTMKDGAVSGFDAALF